MQDLARLAALIQQRNAIDQEIAQLIGRPALIGHVGEYIASRLFGIDLMASASHKGIDGYFGDGPLAGRSVNIKWYAKLEGMLDITPAALPDTYLVLAGPPDSALSSRGATRASAPARRQNRRGDQRPPRPVASGAGVPEAEQPGPAVERGAACPLGAVWFVVSPDSRKSPRLG